MYVSAILPSVSALTVFPKKNVESQKIQICYFWVRSLQVPRPNHAPTLKKGQVDVFPLVFVSADNINVIALLNTDLFTKIWIGQLHAADPKAPTPIK